MFSFFFFNDTATTEIYTLSLHDALPICLRQITAAVGPAAPGRPAIAGRAGTRQAGQADRRGREDEVGAHGRSEEHTSELQSPDHLVCRLLLEKKKKDTKISIKAA